MTRTTFRVLLVLLLLASSACGVPTKKDDHGPEKVAATSPEAKDIFKRHREVRESAYSLLATSPLTTVEAQEVLKIDAGAIRVQQLLGEDARDGGALSSKDVTVSDVYAPVFDSYPLWFVVLARDHDREVTRIQLFARKSAALPWALVASPEALSEDVIPELGRDDEGRIEQVAPDDGSGIAASPQSIVKAYAAVLDDRDAPETSHIERDSFIEQMRKVASTSSAIKGVTYRQAWKAHDVKHAIRTADGGALVFATFTRDDGYRIKKGTFVNWPEGSEQKAFLSGKLYARGKLRYYHQVLLYVPPEGSGKTRAIAQYGGIVDGDGY